MLTVFFSLLSRTISAANFLPRLFLFIRPRFLFFLPTFSAFFLFFINVRSAGSVLPRNRKRERKPRIYGDTDATRPTDCTPEEMYEVDIHFGLWKKSTPFSSLCLSVCLRASISLCTSVSPFNGFFFFHVLAKHRSLSLQFIGAMKRKRFVDSSTIPFIKRFWRLERFCSTSSIAIHTFLPSSAP